MCTAIEGNYMLRDFLFRPIYLFFVAWMCLCVRVKRDIMVDFALHCLLCHLHFKPEANLLPLVTQFNSGFARSLVSDAQKNNCDSDNPSKTLTINGQIAVLLSMKRRPSGQP